MKKNLKFYLKDKLSEKELKLMPTSFDVVGDIMIFSEFPRELGKKERRFRVLTPQKNFSQLTCQALRELDPVA